MFKATVTTNDFFSAGSYMIERRGSVARETIGEVIDEILAELDGAWN